MWKRIIDTFLKVYLAVGIIAVLILTLVGFSKGFFGGLLVLLIGGILVAALGSGLGIIVEIAYHLEAIEQNTQELLRKEVVVNSTSNATTPTASTTETEVKAPKVNTAFANSEMKTWVCGNCNESNSMSTVYCHNCGSHK